MIESSIGSTASWTSSVRPRGQGGWSLLPFAPRVAIACLLIGHAGSAFYAASTAGTLLALSMIGALAAFASVVDLVDERIPNLAVEAIHICVGIAVIVDPQTLVSVLVGALLGGAPLLWVRLSRGIGMGDVKFAAALGAAGGLIHPLTSLVAVFIASGASGAYAIIRHRARMVLGPWLWGGFVAGLAVSPLITASGGVSIGAIR